MYFSSPLSLSTAISILFSGSSSEAAKELKSLLGYDAADLSHEKVCESFKLLHSELETSPDTFSLVSANILFSQKGFAIKQKFKTLINESFGAMAMEVDFQQESTKAVKQANEWVCEKTNGTISQLIESIDPATVMIVLNAVYFKGLWKNKFSSEGTYKQLFFNRGRKENSIEIDMMHMMHDFLYVKEDSFRALDMPYMGDEISMLIILPENSDGLPELEKKVNSGFIAELKTKLVVKEVDVAFPKLQLEYTQSMQPHFEALGLNNIFQRGADFSGISNSKDLVVSEILHKAVLEVNEEGTEAAAGTAEIAMAISMPLSQNEFIMDHPFLFLIYYTKTELILFMGKVDNF